ncbi:MAG: hypothetical protein GX601_04990 [Anaerolineales bacterium]|nr:hypothetical protein [Anaerolineales bacterium]
MRGATDYAHLLNLLTAYEGPGVFNQYRQTDPALDRPEAATIRRANLVSYLEAFAGARYILVGEAAGYAGCRFSGIPFTCEAQLAGPDCLTWAERLNLGRSSTAETPWVERSARIVWKALGERRDCLLWNAFPWHPFGARGPLSNRTPGREVRAGREALECLLALFPQAQPYAVGRTAERALAALGIQTGAIRHPSHGGAAQFAAGVAALGE